MPEQELVQKPKKKTRINKMVMHGFKSFAKHTEVLFGPNFNCVLGPNGAGKSNVLDSLCFVLGKSSSKNLRAEKSANLVYNGGKLKKPAKQGEVSIYFDNTDKIFPYDTQEVKITRIVKQTGQSVYRINDETKTRREVVELLGLAKIDPDGYNIILQGDIVRFVEMPPVERRLLIEDIAGISVYEEKKNKALNELEKVEQHLKETEIILKEREGYLKDLKKDRDQALKYKEMNDKVRQNRASYLKRQIDRKESEAQDVKGKLEKCQQDFEAAKQKIQELVKNNEQKQQELNDISREIEEKGETEQVALNKEVENLKIEITKLHSRKETVKHELEKIVQRRADLEANLGDISKKVEELEKEKRQTSEALDQRRKDLQDVTGKIDQFKQKHKLDDIGNIEQKIDELDKKAEELQKDTHHLREKQHDLIRQKDKLAHEIAIMDDRIQKVAAVEKEHKAQLDAIQKKRQEFKQATLELNKCLDHDSEYAARLTKLRHKLQEDSEELSKLNAKNISIQETTKGEQAIRSILDLKSKWKGIYGTVADLGNVSSKHALALEIAAGNRIKSIVVDSDKVAADCIKYLKANRLGTASFLPLNKVRPRERKKDLDKKANVKGCHGSAMDLVEFDPKFKNVFSYVFENTLVVDTIDVAVKMGVGDAKFVSLEGDVAERSGMMQGGFRSRKKEAYGFKEKELTEKIQKAEAGIQESREAIEVYEKKRLENEEMVTSLRQRKAELEGEIIKDEKSLHLDDRDLGSTKSKKKDLQEQEKQLDKEIDKLVDSISEKNRELAQVKIEKQKHRSTISDLSNPRLVAELNAFEQKKHELKDELIRLESQLKNTERLLSDISTPEQEKVKNILKQLDKEEDSFKQEQKDLDRKTKSKDAELKEKEKMAADFYAQFKGLFAKSNKLKDELNKNLMTIEKKKDESRQVEIRMNTLSLKRSEYSAALSVLNEEFSQYEGVELDTQKTEEELKKEIQRFEQMRENIGSVNMRALDIYEDVERQYKELLEKKDSLGKEREDVLKMMEEIESRKKELFMKTFEIVNSHFIDFFSKLTTKGADARLVLENPEEPFEGGVRINVKISGSKFLDIRSLSGGEKTMTALAFIFAIQEHDPASFYVLDEVDAALDKHNSERLGKLIGKYTGRAQYIIISHNDSIISSADNLYGVSMNEHGISQVVSLKV